VNRNAVVKERGEREITDRGGRPGRANGNRDYLFLLKGVTRPAETQECVGVMQAGTPTAWGLGELLLGYEKPAFPTLKLFLVDFVVAGFREGCE
jgi:hypothetical protein